MRQEPFGNFLTERAKNSPDFCRRLSQTTTKKQCSIPMQGWPEAKQKKFEHRQQNTTYQHRRASRREVPLSKTLFRQKKRRRAPYIRRLKLTYALKFSYQPSVRLPAPVLKRTIARVSGSMHSKTHTAEFTKSGNHFVCTVEEKAGVCM